jgi:L-ascorbate metabolism protein UlaG (beta-lactamase superfamily)
MTDGVPGEPRPFNRYDRSMARWRAVVDWAKERPWAIRLIEPLSRGRGRWRFVDVLTTNPVAPSVAPDLTGWARHVLAACWLGHATVLLRVGQKTILTDPVFARRVGLGWGLGTLGPARFVSPAVTVKQLPPIDLVLLSHAHFDHLDRPTLARLAKRSTQVVCAPHTSDLVHDLGFGEVHELSAGDSMTIDGLTITGLPTRHWGARIVLDQQRGHVAFLVRADDASILYGGDTAYQREWRFIGDAGGVDVAIVGVGAYEPWIDGHANPEQAWQMALDAGARKVLPMHHSTFKLSVEPRDEPLRRLLQAAAGRVEDVICPKIGDCWRRP